MFPGFVLYFFSFYPKMFRSLSRLLSSMFYMQPKRQIYCRKMFYLSCNWCPSTFNILYFTV